MKAHPSTKFRQNSKSFIGLNGQYLVIIFLIVLIAVLINWAGQTTYAQAPLATDDVMAALAATSTVRVIVALNAPNENAEIGISTQQVAQLQNNVLQKIAQDDFQLLHQYETLPGFVGQVTAEGLNGLLNQPEVYAIALDQPIELALTESTKLIRANDVWHNFGFTGANVNVAVLDTGVDIAHVDLADNIVAQHCFSQGNCLPSNTNESNNAQDEHGHGTHIAGIIAGRGQTSPRGVASDAGIVAVRVLGPTGSGLTSDIIAGIDWVVANQAQLNVKVINLSLGVGVYPDVCDQADATTQLFAQAAQAARKVGITIFAASGNRGTTNAMMAPACVSGVVAVGNTYSTNFDTFSFGSICTDIQAVIDQVACSSSSSSQLDLLAPGTAIDAVALGGGQARQSGTSMSTAHATGVAALMLQANSNLTPDEIRTILRETGVPITDTRNGQITPRIDALAAVTQVITGEVTTISGTVLLQGRSNHSGTGIFVSNQACSMANLDTLLATTTSDGRFEITIPVSQDYQCLYAVQSGYLIGQQSLPKGDLGIITLPGGDVTGDGVINIFDLAFIAARHDSSDPAADVNVDGQVDIFDLVIAAGNFNKPGPVSNWQ